MRTCAGSSCPPCHRQRLSAEAVQRSFCPSTVCRAGRGRQSSPAECRVTGTVLILTDIIPGSVALPVSALAAAPVTPPTAAPVPPPTTAPCSGSGSEDAPVRAVAGFRPRPGWAEGPRRAGREDRARARVPAEKARAMAAAWGQVQARVSDKVCSCQVLLSSRTSHEAAGRRCGKPR